MKLSILLTGIFGFLFASISFAAPMQFSCEGNFSSSGDVILIKGTLAEPSVISEIKVTLCEERYGCDENYELRGIAVNDGAPNTSADIINSALKKNDFYWFESEELENVDNFNCFNITNSKTHATVVHVCFAKNMTKPTGYMFSDLMGGRELEGNQMYCQND